MSDAVIQVMKHLARNPHLIEECELIGNEIYFRAGGKAFSILKRTTEIPAGYIFFAYPQWTESLTGLAALLDIISNDDVLIISYNQNEYNNLDDTQAFSQLYTVLMEKSAGMDDIFKKILNS